VSAEPIDDGGSAFPLCVPDYHGDRPHLQNGMSLRDWFAGQALAAMTAAPDYSKGPCDQSMAERAYVIADAMIAARKGGAR